MTVKALTDLQGLKDKNVEELKAIGINNVAELAEAINDDEKVKEVIKSLSGVGPKTVNGWKAALADADVEEAPAEEAASEVVEAAAGQYVVKAKPELDEATTDALAKRAMISGRRPAFKRQEWFRYSKLGEKWRKPKGIHSKMKRQLKRRPPMVDIGFRGPVAARDLHPSGFEEVLVYNVDGLEGIDPKKQAVRIGGTVGTKKRIAIEDRADELGIRVLKGPQQDGVTMADLRNQRRMAAEILKCGENRVWMNPDRLDEVEDCITRADIRTAIDSGLIKAKAKNGTSRARTRYVAGQKASGKRKGPGSRKGTANARVRDKERWMATIRPIRDELKTLRDEGKITPSVYRLYYRKAKGGMFKSRRHLKQHMVAAGHLNEEEI